MDKTNEAHKHRVFDGYSNGINGIKTINVKIKDSDEKPISSRVESLIIEDIRNTHVLDILRRRIQMFNSK